ncbi:hypothetical protein J4411_00280 [Candidatus Pacearchaeota archaeon]|nr:hypothetical protein [Candidatus Pacearchaeota archaeon]
MVYKKYIVKNGRTYGPYIYQSKRINGKVVSEYRGIDEPKKTGKILPIILISVFFIAITGLLIFSNQKISGNVILKIEGDVINGILKNGKISMTLNGGELIPSDSQITFENNGSVYTYNLSDLLVEEEISSGNFYLQNSQISGLGTGYGLEGAKKIFPKISFELQSSENFQQNEENETGGGGTEPPSKENEEKTGSVSNSSKQNETAVEVQNKTETQENNSVSNPEKPIENETLPQESNPTSEINSPAKEEQTPLQSPETLPQESNPTSEINSPAKEEQTPTLTEKEDKTKTDSKNPQAETQSQEPEQTPPQSPETSGNEGAQITGGAIASLFGPISNFLTGLITGNNSKEDTPDTISGIVSKENDFTERSYGKSWEVVSSSIESNGELLPDNSITVENSNESVTVKTNYSLIETGYGEEYLAENTKSLSVDITKLNHTLNEGPLVVKLIYKNNEFVLFEGKISNETIENEIENLTQIFNEINASQLLNFSMNLTQFEKQILLFNINQSYVETTVSKYKDKYLVEFNLGHYSAEYSYPQILTDEELKRYIERDKYLWLKDIVIQFGEKVPPKEKVENMNANLEF